MDLTLPIDRSSQAGAAQYSNPKLFSPWNIKSSSFKIPPISPTSSPNELQQFLESLLGADAKNQLKASLDNQYNNIFENSGDQKSNIANIQNKDTETNTIRTDFETENFETNDADSTANPEERLLEFYAKKIYNAGGFVDKEKEDNSSIIKTAWENWLNLHLSQGKKNNSGNVAETEKAGLQSLTPVELGRVVARMFTLGLSSDKVKSFVTNFTTASSTNADIKSTLAALQDLGVSREIADSVVAATPVSLKDDLYKSAWDILKPEEIKSLFEEQTAQLIPWLSECGFSLPVIHEILYGTGDALVDTDSEPGRKYSDVLAQIIPQNVSLISQKLLEVGLPPETINQVIFATPNEIFQKLLAYKMPRYQAIAIVEKSPSEISEGLTNFGLPELLVEAVMEKSAKEASVAVSKLGLSKPTMAQILLKSPTKPVEISAPEKSDVMQEISPTEFIENLTKDPENAITVLKNGYLNSVPEITKELRLVGVPSYQISKIFKNNASEIQNKLLELGVSPIVVSKIAEKSVQDIVEDIIKSKEVAINTVPKIILNSPSQIRLKLKPLGLSDLIVMDILKPVSENLTVLSETQNVYDKSIDIASIESLIDKLRKLSPYLQSSESENMQTLQNPLIVMKNLENWGLDATDISKTLDVPETAIQALEFYEKLLDESTSLNPNIITILKDDNIPDVFITSMLKEPLVVIKYAIDAGIPPKTIVDILNPELESIDLSTNNEKVMSEVISGYVSTLKDLTKEIPYDSAFDILKLPSAAVNKLLSDNIPPQDILKVLMFLGGEPTLQQFDDLLKYITMEENKASINTPSNLLKLSLPFLSVVYEGGLDIDQVQQLVEKSLEIVPKMKIAGMADTDILTALWNPKLAMKTLLSQGLPYAYVQEIFSPPEVTFDTLQAYYQLTPSASHEVIQQILQIPLEVASKLQLSPEETVSLFMSPGLIVPQILRTSTKVVADAPVELINDVQTKIYEKLSGIISELALTDKTSMDSTLVALKDLAISIAKIQEVIPLESPEGEFEYFPEPSLQPKQTRSPEDIVNAASNVMKVTNALKSIGVNEKLIPQILTLPPSVFIESSLETPEMTKTVVSELLKPLSEQEILNNPKKWMEAEQVVEALVVKLTEMQVPMTILPNVAVLSLKPFESLIELGVPSKALTSVLQSLGNATMELTNVDISDSQYESLVKNLSELLDLMRISGDAIPAASEEKLKDMDSTDSLAPLNNVIVPLSIDQIESIIIKVLEICRKEKLGIHPDNNKKRMLMLPIQGSSQSGNGNTDSPLNIVPKDFWDLVPTVAPNTTILDPGYWAAKKSLFISKLFDTLAKVTLNFTNAARSTTTESPLQHLKEKVNSVLLSEAAARRSVHSEESSSEETATDDQELINSEEPKDLPKEPKNPLHKLFKFGVQKTILSDLSSTSLAPPTTTTVTTVTPITSAKPSTIDEQKEILSKLKKLYKAARDSTKKSKKKSNRNHKFRNHNKQSSSTTTENPIDFEELAKALLGQPDN